MNWNSWQAFFAMGGYGLYVWGSVVVVFVAILFEFAQVLLQRRAVIDQVRNLR